MVTTQPVPHVAPEEQVTVAPLGHGLFDVVVALRIHGGPERPEALACARASRGWSWTRAT